jgi:methanogenic corrinoid protein MtbC1
MAENYIYNDFTAFLLAGDRLGGSVSVIKYLDDNPGIVDLYERIIKASMYEVGDLWESGRISVATEHLASAIVEAILNELYDRVISDNRKKKNVVVSCVEGEFHQIGVKMVADVFEMQGWDAHFLGANTPTTELISFIGDVKPDVLALSLSISAHLQTLENALMSIRKAFPDLTVIVGGYAFTWGGQEILLKYPNVHYTDNLYSIESFIRELELSQ